jgi:hypothetical protein
MATAMQENLLFEFYAGFGTNKVITWSNKTKSALTRVCVSLSNEPLITCGEFGFMERIERL